jgi:hypothetical protein
MFQPIPYTDKDILQYIIGIFMFHYHSPDMPVQFLLVLLYNGRERLFFGFRVPKLQKQLGILDGHPHG